MKRGKPLRRKTPLRRGSSSLRSSPLRPRSEKAAATAAKRREIAALIGPLAFCEYPGCNRSADDWHERLPRSQGGDPTDPANRVCLCRLHHRAVHDNPREAVRLGLLERRWRAES